MTFTITGLNEKDLPSLAKLFSQFWGESSRIDKMRIAFQKMADNPAYILLAARQEGELAGFGMGIICQELYGEARPFMVVEDLVVDKNRRRSGIGAGLMKELEKQASIQDCCQIILVTERDRTDARRFYEAMGYRSDKYSGFKKAIGNGEWKRPG